MHLIALCTVVVPVCLLLYSCVAAFPPNPNANAWCQSGYIMINGKTTQNRSKKRRADHVPNTPIVVNLVKEEMKMKKKKTKNTVNAKKKDITHFATVYTVADITIKCINQNKGTCMLII